MTRKLTLGGLLLAFASAFWLAGCTGPDTYPITGEECHADDPVQGMEARDCTAPN